MKTSVCLHCEKEPPRTTNGLCAGCHAHRGIRRLYLRRRGRWSPTWEAHLRRLTARASAGLSLFPEAENPS